MAETPGALARARLDGLAIAVAAVAAAALVASLLLVVGGFHPVAAGRALVNGAFGGRDAFLSITLVGSVPLILTGLAVALAFRAGVWNIGAEGQLYAGAVAAVWVGLEWGTLPEPLLIPAVLGAGALAGAAWAAVPALLRQRLGVGEVITTILMNFIGIHLAAYMVHGPLQEPRGVFPQTDQIAAAARLPLLVTNTRLHVGFALAVALAAGLAVLLRRTRVGFQIRAVGASPTAARIAGGIDTDRVVLWSFLASGAIAGIAGGVEISGVTWALYEELSPGWGYTAIAVALLAGLHPLAVVLTGILFGALETGADAMQRDAGIPAVWAGVVEALVILAVLAFHRLGLRARRRRAGPGPAGIGGPSAPEAHAPAREPIGG